VVPTAPAQLCRHRSSSFLQWLSSVAKCGAIEARIPPERKEPLPGGAAPRRQTLGEPSLRRRGHPQYQELGNPADLYLAHGDARLHKGAVAALTPDRPIRQRGMRRHDVVSIRERSDTPGRGDAKFTCASHTGRRRLGAVRPGHRPGAP
jgi:hypothetical protein